MFGTVDQRNLRGPQHVEYTCKGTEEEEWEPTFTYIGHRFIELHGHQWAAPTSTTVQQRVIHSDVEAAPLETQTIPRTLAGSIAFSNGDQGATAPAIDGDKCYEGEGCSAARPAGAATKTAVLDQLSHNVRWDLIDNLHSVPEDCDQRNERWGWMASILWPMLDLGPRSSIFWHTRVCLTWGHGLRYITLYGSGWIRMLAQ